MIFAKVTFSRKKKRNIHVPLITACLYFSPLTTAFNSLRLFFALPLGAGGGELNAVKFEGTMVSDLHTNICLHNMK